MAVTAASKTIILITGANSGIGFELASQLLSRGTYHVLLGARSVSKGETALSTLQSFKHPGTAEFLHLDVTSDETITAAEEKVRKEHGRLDMLVNNAAISGMDVKEGLREELRQAFDTNATGPAILASTFLPLMQASTNPNKRIVNVSSGAGSISRRLDPTSAMYKMKGGWQYRASKAAMNMLHACMAVEYKEFGIKVLAFDPGYTQSNLSAYNTKENGARSAEESVRPLVELIERKRDEEEPMLLHNAGAYGW